mgnify:FL=1
MLSKKNIPFILGKHVGRYAKNKIINKTLNVAKEKITSGAGITGVATGTAAAMTTTSLGLKGAFLGSFVALNASTVAVPLAAAGGYVAFNAYKGRKHRKENEALKSKLFKFKDIIDNEELLARFKDLSQNKILDVEGSSAHRKLLIQTINQAKETVVVYSGWVLDYSIDEEFKQILKNALLRGVNFYLGYGYVDSQKRNNINKDRMEKTEQGLIKLQEWSNNIQSEGKLKIIKFPNHKKILTCDYKYIVCGSYNWLSNKFSKNQEYSLQIFNKKFTKEKVEYFISQFDRSYNRREFISKFSHLSEYP